MTVTGYCIVKNIGGIMPRTIRIQFPGATYHVYSRGNEKKAIYKDDHDRKKFIDIMARVKSKIDFDLYAYVLMKNHYHILMNVPGENLGKIMQLINTAYSVYFNWKYKRVGHLYQNRYNSIVVGDDNYFMDLTRYIHLNPLGKEGHEKLWKYQWSSLRQYIGGGQGLASPGRALKMFDQDRSTAIKRYKDFLMEGGRLTGDEIKQDMFTSLVIGSEDFSRQVYERLRKKCKTVPESILRSNRSNPESIMDAITAESGTGRSEILRKRGKANYARKAAIYLAYKHTAMTYGELAGVFGNTHQSNITRAIKSAQAELADNTDFAGLISRAEQRIKQR
jgi:putative transposase